MMNDERREELNDILTNAFGWCHEGYEESLEITDYQSLDNGSLEVVVFTDAFAASYQPFYQYFFWVGKDSETLIYGNLATKKTAGDVLALYIHSVENETLDRSVDCEGLKLRTRREYLDELNQRK